MGALRTTLIAVVATAALATTAVAQSPTPSPPKAPTPPRDPHTAGYVTATELEDGAVPPIDADGNFSIGPSHPPAPELAAKDAVLQGTVSSFTLSSGDSSYYPGIARDPQTPGVPDPANADRLIAIASRPAPYTRQVTVYVPKSYSSGAVAPFIVGADGPDPVLFAALDSLIAQRRLPPMIAISIGNGGGDRQGSERGLEYDTMSGRYAEFVEHEVLPEVERRLRLRLTRDPEGRATTGGSSGGACALIMAWYHPELYHRVLTYSGTFVNQQWPWNRETPGGAWDFHARLIPQSPRKPLRIWMEVSDKELDVNLLNDGKHDWILANERMAKVLSDKGYPYQFIFARNAVHVDPAVRRQTLPEALEWLWRDYRAK